MSHPVAIAMRSANSTARPFSTGSTPGRPSETGSISLLGGAPNAADGPEKIFERVWSCTWHSRPMTGSHSAKRRPPFVPIGARLIRARDLEQPGLAERRSQKLHSNRQAAGEATRNRHAGQAGQIA